MINSVIASSCQSLIKLNLNTRSQAKRQQGQGSEGWPNKDVEAEISQAEGYVKEPELHPHGSVFQPRSHASESPGQWPGSRFPGLTQT